MEQHRGQFGFDKASTRGMQQEIDRLMREENMSYSQAAFVAAATLDGAGESATVESIQTCTELGGIPVPGLTGDDSVTCRLDRHAATETKRQWAADHGDDEAAQWLRENSPETYAKLYGKK